MNPNQTKKSLSFTPYTKNTSIDEENALLEIKDSNFNTATFEEGNTEISFHNCRFFNFTIANSEIINFEKISISFFNCFVRNLDIEEIASPNISIGFYGSIVAGKINNGNVQYIDFNNCLTSGFFVTNVSKVNISYTKENIPLDHWEGLCKQLRISDVQKVVQEPIRYYIEGAKFLNCSSNFDGEYRDRFKPDLRLIFPNHVVDIETLVSGLSLSSLSLSGTSSGTISIEKTRINSWYIYSFYPKGRASFYDILPISRTDTNVRIGIYKCILDKVEFDNIAFDQYPIISFYRTQFSKALFTSCDFPDTYRTFSRFVERENVHLPEQNPRNYDKAQYEIFLQLKKAMEDRGNFQESQKLQSMAHEALRKVKNGISRSDRGILHVNSWSNDHGLSIWKPFRGFLLFSIPSYLIYLLSIGRLFQSTEIDYNLIGYYFSFVDITHRSDFLTKQELCGWSLAIDYLSKLGIGFFIYQFIAAFRKYGKK